MTIKIIAKVQSLFETTAYFFVNFVSTYDNAVRYCLLKATKNKVHSNLKGLLFCLHQLFRRFTEPILSNFLDTNFSYSPTSMMPSETIIAFSFRGSINSILYGCWSLLL